MSNASGKRGRKRKRVTKKLNAKSYKQIACGFNYFIKVMALSGIFYMSKIAAQDTVSLNQVEIISQKQFLSQLGKRCEAIDTLTKEQFRFNSIADLLQLNSQVFIKSYGPGALASTAFRGGNASQTAILWNGLNLQNAMLGQSDLSLMPSVLFESIEIEYGGSSSVWGTGAVGGSIHLNTKNQFNKGFTTTTNLATASFGEIKASTNLSFSTKNFSSSTKLYAINSKNNFSFRDTTDKENPLKTQQHAAYNFKGLTQDLKWLLNAKHSLSVNAWLNSNFRQLPAFTSSSESKAYQLDAAIRLSTSWLYLKNKFKSTTKAAYFNDKINYTDSLISLFSKSTAKTTVLENESYYNWGKNNQFNIGINFTDSRAESNNYNSTKGIRRVSFLAGNKFSFLKNKFIVYFSSRIEYFSVGKLPLTGSLSLDYKATKNIKLSCHTGRVYRQPTLNELYWIPGGNSQIKPEHGYTVEGTLQYQKQIKKMTIVLSGAAYSRLINDWILWVPGSGGNPSPINIQQVHSRGSETDWKVTYAKNKWKIGFKVLSSYVLSTVSANTQENSESTGRQLIYTPRYSVNSNFLVAYNKINVVFYYQYVGYRFTNSDNSEWLTPYQTFTIKLSHTLELNETTFSIYAAGYNLFNSNYTIVAGRPMPLRNFELGMTLRTNKKTKK
jgi:vitamin B12 transporter